MKGESKVVSTVPYFKPGSIVVDSGTASPGPSPWKLSKKVYHRKLGLVVLRKESGHLFLNEKHIIAREMERFGQCWKLQEQVHVLQVPNVCILDALIEHQYLIPDYWERDVYFWGTVYSEDSAEIVFPDRYVPYMSKQANGKWIKKFESFRGELCKDRRMALMEG